MKTTNASGKESGKVRRKTESGRSTRRDDVRIGKRTASDRTGGTRDTHGTRDAYSTRDTHGTRDAHRTSSAHGTRDAYSTRDAHGTRGAHGTRAARGTRGIRGKKASSRKGSSRKNGEVLLTQNRRQNKMSLFLAAMVVFILLIAVAVNGIALSRRLRENRSRARELQQEIQSEEQRAADIEEYSRYTETDAYIEEVAREKLGLIYEGETVFKEENK